MTATDTSVYARRRQNKAAAGAFVGTSMEWYDFFIFGTAAALAFDKVFYPSISPAAGILASFATFWVGFIARPFGGLLFGHLGDKHGRKNTLVVTLLIMGLATTLIGLLPSYGAIGIWSPIMLIVLRACQGLAVGGEWGGAVAMATEGAPSEKKGFLGSWVQQGSPVGSILATLVFLLVGTLPDDAFMSWGWRVPFLLSALLLIVSLIIRSQVEESTDFAKVKESGDIATVPAAQVFTKAPIALILVVVTSVWGIAAAFFNNTFLVSWATAGAGMDRQVILNAVFISAIVQFIWQPFAALLAQKLGQATVMVAGLGLGIVMIVPLYLAVLNASNLWVTVFLSVSVVGGAAHYSLLAGFVSEAFPVNIRYSGVALANGICAALIGGSTPLIAQSILGSAGPVGVGIFNVAEIVVTGAGVIMLSRFMKNRRTQ